MCSVFLGKETFFAGRCADDDGKDGVEAEIITGVLQHHCYGQCINNATLKGCAYLKRRKICITYSSYVSKGEGEKGFKCFIPGVLD